MSDPGQRRGCAISNLLLVILLVGLVYVIYTLLGGDLSTLTRIGSSSGEGPVAQVMNSLRAMGESISNSFSNMLR